MAGYESKSKHTYMTMRERLDFVLIMSSFGVLVGV